MAVNISETRVVQITHTQSNNISNRLRENKINSPYKVHIVYNI